MKKTDRSFTFRELSSREKRNNKQIITKALKVPNTISILEKNHKNKEIFWVIFFFLKKIFGLSLGKGKRFYGKRTALYDAYIFLPGPYTYDE